MVTEGADIIDIGGESSRPGAAPISEEEEMRRVLPVIEQLAARVPTPISIDTVKPSVARAALRAGASIVNDIAANRADAEMWRVAAETGAAYILMHMQGTPQTMQKNPQYGDVVKEVRAFFEDRLQRVESIGVARERIILDVGIGFGKTLEHNLALLRSLREFQKFQRPLLVGVSRKSFIGRITDAAHPLARLPGSLACTCWAVEQGIQMVRTHDIAATRQAIRMTEALLSRS
jgi:dihydropteroate synthase